MSYTVLQECFTGSKCTLRAANYGEHFDTYRQAYRFAQKVNFLFGVVRSDRVYDVVTRYERKNN